MLCACPLRQLAPFLLVIIAILTPHIQAARADLPFSKLRLTISTAAIAKQKILKCGGKDFKQAQLNKMVRRAAKRDRTELFCWRGEGNARRFRKATAKSVKQFVKKVKAGFAAKAQSN